jgi:hypothetical protein
MSGPHNCQAVASTLNAFTPVSSTDNAPLTMAGFRAD